MEELYYKFDADKLNEVLKILDENVEKNYTKIVDECRGKSLLDLHPHYELNIVKLCEDFKILYDMFAKDEIDIPCLLQIINIRYKKDLSINNIIISDFHKIFLISVIKINNYMDKKGIYDICFYELLLFLFYNMKRAILQIKNLIGEVLLDYNFHPNSVIKSCINKYYMDIIDELKKIFNNVEEYIENIINKVNKIDNKNTIVWNIFKKIRNLKNVKFENINIIFLYNILLRENNKNKECNSYGVNVNDISVYNLNVPNYDEYFF